MKAGKRIVFEATGEVRPPKHGENFVECGGVARAYGDFKIAPWPILRRVPDEQVALERECVEACREIDGSGERYTFAQIDRCRSAGRALNAHLAPKPRYVATHLAIFGAWIVHPEDKKPADTGNWTRLALTGPDAERHAREFAERMNGGKP